MRLLDVGCGWGSLVLHAAATYGVQAVGVTISPEQADFARRRVAKAGLEDRVEIRLQDYREVSDGPYDAVASIGMAEHVGRAQLPVYARALHALLPPGGRLLNHAIARGPDAGPDSGGSRSFLSRYVFPDGELQPLADHVGFLEAAGFEVRDVEGLRAHYALTCRAWAARAGDRVGGGAPRRLAGPGAGVAALSRRRRARVRAAPGRGEPDRGHPGGPHRGFGLLAVAAPGLGQRGRRRLTSYSSRTNSEPIPAMCSTCSKRGLAFRMTAG